MPAAISIRVKAPKQPYCFLIRPFDEQFNDVEAAVTEAAKKRSLLVATSKNIQDHLKWIENVEYGILAARLVVAICSPQYPPGTRPSRHVLSNTINANVIYELGRALAVGKPTLILAANRAALPIDVTWPSILEYDVKNVSLAIDKIAGALQTLQDNCENGLVDKRANHVTSLCGVPAALASPDFLSYLRDVLSVSLEYYERMRFLEIYIKNYRDSYANARETSNPVFSVKYFTKQYIESTPRLLCNLLDTRKRHDKIASLPDDLPDTCDVFSEAIAKADGEIGKACSSISTALADNFGVDRGSEDEYIDRVNSAIHIISQENAKILSVVHDIIQEGGKRR